MISKIINKIIDNDIGYSFMKSKIAITSSIIFFIILFCSAFAECRIFAILTSTSISERVPRKSGLGALQMPMF